MAYSDDDSYNSVAFSDDDRDSDSDYLPPGYSNSYSNNTNPNNSPGIFLRRYFAIFVAFVVFLPFICS
jgi:hypothetical protein